MSLPYPPSTPPSPKTLVDEGVSVEPDFADLQLYDLGASQGPRPSTPPCIDPLQRETYGCTLTRTPFEPVNTNTGIRRATAPPRIDFTGIVNGFATDSPPLSSPMIREQHAPMPHYPFHMGNAENNLRASFSRSSSSISGTLVDSPERKGSIALSPTLSRINAGGTPIESGVISDGYFGPRQPGSLQRSVGGAHSPLSSLVPRRPDISRRHSSYRSVVSDLANPGLIDASTGTGKVFAVKPLVTRLQGQLSDAVAALKEPVRIVGILASGDSGCQMYASTLAKSSEKLGVKFDLKLVDWHTEDGSDKRFDKVATTIRHVNEDIEVDGIFLFLPIFGTNTDKALRDLVDPRLDLEGINATSLAFSSRHPNALAPKPNSGPCHPYPCTPLAVAHILKELDVYDTTSSVGSRLQGKTITVINRSETVGMPLACLFANDGAQVYSVDIHGISLFVPNLTSAESLSTSGLDCGVYCGSCYNQETDSIDPVPEKACSTDLDANPYPDFTIHTAPQLSLETCLSLSDVVMSAVPSSTYKVPTAALMPGCVCINVAEHSNFEDSVCDRAKWLVPRVGSVTRLMVLYNAVNAVMSKA